MPCAARREPTYSIRLLVLMSTAVNQAFVYAKNKTAGFPIRRSEIIGGWHESRNGGCCFDSGPKATLFVCRKRFVQFYYFGSTWFACESGRGCGCHLPRPRPSSQLLPNDRSRAKQKPFEFVLCQIIHPPAWYKMVIFNRQSISIPIFKID